ncbi:MAG: quinolinate synthase NadA [Muribaculaceae bacterium]|nr:quinolinate synthase NadA [Muribaculaceae bacterium]
MDVDKDTIIDEIKHLKEKHNAVIYAHYYQRPEIQNIADAIGDSLALARIAQNSDADVIILCGVNFMAETAAILCPDKIVICPDITAGCSLADSCPADKFKEFINNHPGHTVISYVNTSADVKALTDVVVTSSNARQIVESFPLDEKIIFGPDRNLGNYINSISGRNMVLWDGACHVHEKFSLEKILNLKKQHPDAKILAHPECRKSIILVADKVGSTQALLNYAIDNEANKFIVATESGIIHEMKRLAPDKHFIPAPPDDADCACNECSYMKQNTLVNVLNSLRSLSPRVIVDKNIADKARIPIERMLNISSKLGL